MNDTLPYCTMQIEIRDPTEIIHWFERILKVFQKIVRLLLKTVVQIYMYLFAVHGILSKKKNQQKNKTQIFLINMRTFSNKS